MMDTDPGLQDACARFRAKALALERRIGANDAELPADMREMLALIGEQPELRFFVDGTRNLGHQASTVAMVKRIIDLTGFAGRVLVVYLEPRRELLGRTAEKLALMFLGLDPQDIDRCVVRYGTCSQIRFLELSRCAEIAEPAAFGFTGGADDMRLDLATALHVRFLARLQPYLWDDDASMKADRYYQSSRIEQPHGRHLVLVDAYPGFRCLGFKVPAPASVPDAVWTWYGHAQRFDAGLAVRTRNARALEEGLCQGPAGSGPLAWPVYGLQHFPDTAAQVLLHLVLAALRVQAVARRPVVVVVYSPLDAMPQWSDLVRPLAQDLGARDGGLGSLRAALGAIPGAGDPGGIDRAVEALRGWLMAAGDGRVTVRLHEGWDRQAGCWVDMTHGLSNSLAPADWREVNVAGLGPVPMEIFHHQLVGLPGLPCVVEGQATASLLNSCGRPYLQMRRAEPGVRGGDAPCPGGSEWSATVRELNRVAAGLGDARLVAGDPQDYLGCVQRTAAFALSCLDPRSDASRYFRLLGEFHGQDIHDRLLVGLLAVREVAMAGAAAPGRTLNSCGRRANGAGAAAAHDRNLNGRMET